MSEEIEKIWIPTPAPVNRAFWQDPFQVRQLKSWIADLPRGDLLVTARRLEEKINALNLIRTSTAKRQRASAQLFQIHLQLFGQYCKHLQEQSQAEEIQHLQLLLEHHLVALIQSQKIIINQTAKRKTRNCHLALANSFHYLRQIQLLYYLQKLRLTPRYWGEIHQLYHLACALGFSNPESGAKTDLLRQQYLSLLLFGTCNPFQFDQQQLTAIHHHLEQWTQLCTLKKQWSDHSLFLVPLRQAQQPSYVQAQQLIDGPEGDYLYLDTLELAKQLLRDHLDSPIPTSAARAQPLEDAYTRLAQAWSQPPERKFPRFNTDQKLTLVCGLVGLSQYLFLKSSKARAEAELTKIQDSVLESIALTNSSALGFCIRVAGNIKWSQEVGDVVGLRVREEADSQWQVAIIRWQEWDSKGDKILVGLEILASQISPILAKKHENTDGYNIYGLLIKDQESEGRESLIMLPSYTFKTYDLLSIRHHQQQQTIELLNSLNTNSHYSIYEFRRLSKSASEP